MLNMGQGNETAQDLDSAELEVQFLSAIGFSGVSETREPDSQRKLKPPSQPHSHVRNELSDLVEERGHPCNLPADQPGTRTRNRSRAQQALLRNQTKGLTITYWDAQRIAKGIVDPSAYLYYEDEPIGSTTSYHPDVNHTSSLTSLHPRLRVSETQKFESVPFGRGSVPREEPESSSIGRRRVRGQKGGGPRGVGAGGDEQHGGRTNGRDGGGRAPQLDQLEPDLRMYRMPRPDRNYPGSSYSLPSLGSGFNISNNGVDARQSKGTDADIRNTIGLKPSIYKSPALGNTWTKYNWSDPNGRDADEVFTQASYLGTFINAWMKGVPKNVVANLSHCGEAYWRCDIDTFTGRLLPPVIQPETMLDPTPLDPNMDWRRRNWTSTLLRKHYNTRRNGRLRENKHFTLPTQLEYAAPEGIAIDEPVIERPEYHRFVPRIASFLRPAVKSDMEAVCAIYNWEVKHGLQALDSQPLSVEEFQNILGTTRQLGMPFIVAVRGSARDLGLTEGNLSFSVFQQIPFQDKQSRGEILGFAFLSVWQPGLVGSANGSSRATARVNVFVHPDYRRKKIGFSLLDMLLTTVSDCFSSETAYDFVDPDNSPVYKKGPNRQRQYFKVYLNYRVRHKLPDEGNQKLDSKQKTYDADLVWVRKLVEDRLNFTELVRYEAVHRSARGRGQPVCWMDEVVFEHTCSFRGPTMVEAEY
ncbi:hypothetical protein MYCTH_101399 [Thermothelomyces thermophilus ATCC 42464]|uniref:N-acetyltransferase domain-containing protein n=1 Tax=Thermothelomyces thermophilus (strain ATCC 42464 / BCRC 31852 / DSM 1799) TaxID=573729 RepID=G2QCG2_THET4|nr:uncharacterized protein MYCTH_101399 [Thermothelomyces thermophilus ATCC 42464]AEO58138.1 hypothetical protein MYCTH_101399 [Thermothelomyces thermophilus ATCC 42464]